MHLPLAAAESATTATTAISAALVPAGRPASRATAGLIGEPLRSEEFLFTRCEGEYSAAVSTGQVFV
jgi:hypothetical protein